MTRRRAVGWMFVFTLTVIIIAAISKRRFPPGPTITQLFLIGIFLLIWAAHSRLRNLWLDLGRGQRAYLTVFFILILLGPATGSYRGLYPFITWTMYGRNNPEAKYVEFRAQFKSGKTDDFPVHLAYPSGERAFMTRFDFDKGDAAKATKDLQHMIGMYNQRNPADPVVSIEVIRCGVPMRDFKGMESVRRETLARVEAP